MKNITNTIINIFLCATLFACTGGSDSDKPETTPAPEITPEPPSGKVFTVSGKVYGLDGQALSIKINDDESIEVKNADTFSFSTTFTDQKAANVTIAEQPENMSCQVINADSIIENADVTDVIVQCKAQTASCNKTTAASTNPLDLSGNNVEGIEAIVEDVECGLQQWRIDAQQRINQHRKTSGKITLVDKNGDVVNNAKVRLQLQQHHFKFGGIVQSKMWDGAQGNISDLYRQTYLGFNFNKAGLQNGLKYKLRNSFEEITARIIPWLNSYDIPVRGHALIWPGWSHMEPSISESDATRMGIAAGAPANLSPTDLKIYVDTIISEWAAKWDVDEWDVANEVRGNHDVQDTAGLGYEQEAYWFKHAKQHVKNPTATLYLNENRVVSDTATGLITNRMKTFEADILSILDNDGPLEALGLQSRYGTLVNGELLDAETMYQRLSYFDKYQLPIAATEFEIKGLGENNHGIEGEFDRAKMTERVMSVYFSKENVTDILVWTFFDKSDVTNRHIVELDGSPNLRGKTWLYMVKKHWHTDELSWFNRDGKLDFSGFKGKYKATISLADFSEENVEFDWIEGSSGLTLQLPNYVN